MKFFNAKMLMLAIAAHPFVEGEDVMDNFSKNPNLMYGWYRGANNIDYGIGYCNNRINDPADSDPMTLEECASACLDCNENGACGPTEESPLRPRGLTFNECASFERNDAGRCFIFPVAYPSDPLRSEGCSWVPFDESLDYYELITPASPPESTCEFDANEFDYTCAENEPNPRSTECEYDFGSDFEIEITFTAAPDQELTFTGNHNIATQIFFARNFADYDGMISLSWHPTLKKIAFQFFVNYQQTGIDGNHFYPLNESLETGQEYVVRASFKSNVFSWSIVGYDGNMEEEVIPAEETPSFEVISFCYGGGGGRREFTGSVALTNFEGTCACPTVETPELTPVETPELTPVETPELTPVETPESTTSESAGAHGDPHLVTWSGELYDFHGICDLVLLSNPEFKGNKGLDIHIRTKRIHQFSYIESSVIRIENDIIEVTGGKNNMNKVRINGLIHEIESTDDKEESLDILGYGIRFKRMGDKAQQFVVDLGGGFEESIVVKTWNSFVSIKVQNPTVNNFGSSVGLMGRYPSGEKIARDNKTVLDDINVFGQEWQVNGEEAKLFHEAKGPQFPQKCEIPSSSDMRRRLADSDITMKRAEDICSDVKEYKEMCIFDVMVTNDLTIVGAY